MMEVFIRRWMWVLLIALLFCPVKPENQKDPQNSRITPVQQQLPDFVPGVVVVKFRDGLTFGEVIVRTGIDEVDIEFTRIGATEIRRVLPDLNGQMPQGVSQIAGIYSVYFATGENVIDVAERLNKYDDIAYAEPKRLYRLNETPDDPLYSTMNQFSRVRAEAAWDRIKCEQDSVVIAVIDGGTDWNHPDLSANVWLNPGEVAGNGIDDDGNGFIDDVRGWNFANSSNDPSGLYWTPISSKHGCHVSGIAAGVTDNSTGIASISWNPHLMAVNVASPIFDNAVAFGFEGIIYAAVNGADVINCSWGGLGAPSSFEQDAIDFAIANGALVVAAAGNGGSDVLGDNNDLYPFYPAAYNGVVGVGATSKSNDQKAAFSNYGASVDVFAPGVGILSTLPGSVYSDSYSGTSMSTAMVSGLAALVRSQRPWYSVRQLREQIRVSADNIDGENDPQLAGLLGKGRINAERAVSDFSIPAVRVKSVSYVEPGGNGVINSGELVDLEVQLHNYLANSGSLSFTLSAFSSNVSLNSTNANLAYLDSAATASVFFQFTVDQGVPDGSIIGLYLDIIGDNYQDRDLIYLTVNPPRLANHQTSTLLATITSEANLGFVGFAGESEGEGFVHSGFNYLYEGGLLIGAGPNQVSDCIRGANQSVQDTDFRIADGEEIVMVSPGQFASQEASLLMVDSSASAPIGLSVLQESFADDHPGHQDFLMLRYTIQNNNPTDLHDIYAGLFFDWDIYVDDYGRYDSTRNMGYVMDAPTPSKIAAVKLLSDVGDVNYRTLHNPDELYNGFSSLEKWSFLSGGIQRTDLDDVDVSSILSAGPLSIPAGESVVVGFAVIAAGSLQDLQAYADSAQSFWDRPTAIEPVLSNSLPDKFVLKQNYPNPFNPSTSVEFGIRLSAPGASRVGNSQWVTLTIFDILGRQVRVLVDEKRAAGSHVVSWDGRDQSGRLVAAGTYFYRLEAGGKSLTRTMTLIK